MVKALKTIIPEVNFLRLSENVAPLYLWHRTKHVGRPSVLVVDLDEHYVALVGSLGDRFIVIDSAENQLVFHYSQNELMARWKSQNESYYAIVL
jgi:hypothetical protein